MLSSHFPLAGKTGDENVGTPSMKHKLARSFLSALPEEKNAFYQLYALDMLQFGHIMLHRSLDVQTFCTSQTGVNAPDETIKR